MFYSFSPAVDENTIHTGFYIVLVAVILIGIIICVMVNEDASSSDSTLHTTIWIVVVIGVCVLAYPFYASFIKRYPIPNNERVTATLADHSWNRTESCGKYSVCDYSYVVYQTPDGDVSFRRSPGVVYPKTAILYKN